MYMYNASTYSCTSLANTLSDSLHYQLIDLYMCMCVWGGGGGGGECGKGEGGGWGTR